MQVQKALCRLHMVWANRSMPKISVNWLVTAYVEQCAVAEAQRDARVLRRLEQEMATSRPRPNASKRDEQIILRTITMPIAHDAVTSLADAAQSRNCWGHSQGKHRRHRPRFRL
jgi:hypothetical protein